MEKHNDIQAIQLYNKVMSIPQVQSLYQMATCNRKNNYRNVRLQDTVLIRLCGYAGNNLYKAFESDQMTKKELAFYEAFDYYVTSIEKQGYTVMYTSSDCGENGIYLYGKLVCSGYTIWRVTGYTLFDIRFFKQWQLKEICNTLRNR